MKNALLVLVGLFAGLWLSERQRNEILERKVSTPEGQISPRQDRTLEEMSPSYAANPHPLKQLSSIREDNFVAYVKRLAAELIKPHMTPLESKLVSDYFGNSLVSARGYDRMRQMLKDDQSEKWLSDVFDTEDSENEF